MRIGAGSENHDTAGGGSIGTSRSLDDIYRFWKSHLAIVWLYQFSNLLFPSESVTVKSGSGTALVKQFDIQTSDGVIHAIDTVIWKQLNTWNLPPWKFDIVIAIWRYYTSTSNGLSLHFDACEHNLGVKKKDINCPTQFKESKSSTHQQQQLYSDRRLRVLRDGNACLAYPLLIEFSLS